MVATFIAGGVFFGLAVLGLSVGIIFKKRTPLKGECHGPVDGGGSCSTCGGHSGGCADDSAANDPGEARKDFLRGDFELQKASNPPRLFR